MPNTAAIPRHYRRGVQRTRRRNSMRVRNITTCALGLAAALTLGSELSAQQTQDTLQLRRTTSETRINVSKGEVVPARVDTVYVTRYDTVRVDNTIVRVDTVTV